MKNNTQWRLMLLTCDFNTQIVRKEQEAAKNYEFWKGSNSNGKLLTRFIQYHGLTIMNYKNVTGMKFERKNAAYISRSSAGGPSRINIHL
eukprot:snap_masked-scaffold_6-processed-gene-11.42-mRNA-1 protein AED:0.42 eAED:1.00 QI:0/-1/0/1/-1/1/1/0/89